MDPLLIVKTGTTLFPIAARQGDVEDWITAGMGIDPQSVMVASVCEGAELPEPTNLAGVVVTGSAAMVSHREPWSERTARWIRTAVECATPILGVCYGHQLLAHALGGSVGPTPGGREMGTSSVHFEAQAVAKDPLLAELPPSVPLNVSHVESVLELPTGALRLATTALDGNHAFRLGRSIWGIQFHPESDADVMRRYIEARREILESEGFDPSAMQQEVQDTPHGDTILERFGRIVASSGSSR